MPDFLFDLLAFVVAMMINPLTLIPFCFVIALILCIGHGINTWIYLRECDRKDMEKAKQQEREAWSGTPARRRRERAMRRAAAG